MSYDYDALVNQLAKHRGLVAAQQEAAEASTNKLEHLQEALQVFDELSGHCPMTPLLWMQYAYDMSELMQSLSTEASSTSSLLQPRLQTLELGLNEFPGSAILHLHYCELLVKHCVKISKDSKGHNEALLMDQTQTALTRALQQVGGGSHRNEGELIAQLYRLWAHFWVHCKHNNDDNNKNVHEIIRNSFVQRAQTPLQQANEDLKEEVQDFCQRHTIALDDAFLQQLEDARRMEAKLYSKLIPLEDDVDVAMHQEHIKLDATQLFASLGDSNNNDTDSELVFLTTTSKFTKAILLQGNNNNADNSDDSPPPTQLRYWNGLGGAATATAFLKYATAARKVNFSSIILEESNNNSNDKQELQRQQHQLVLNIYERAIAECPTVESIWLAYLKHLVWLWNHATSYAPTPQQLKTIAVRAVRNCPFSLALVQQQLQTALLLANQQQQHDNNNGNAEQQQYVMDPDELLEIVSKALDSKFLPTPAQSLDLYMTAIRVVQRRVLTLLATTATGYKYDPTANNTKASKQAQSPVLMNYDEAELMPSKVSNKMSSSTGLSTRLDEDAWQEVQDLCEEMRDMYETANARLNQDHASWTEGRALLRLEWATMEQFVLTPLVTQNDTTAAANGNNSDHKENDTGKLLAHYEKVIRLHNPSHPDSYRALIQHVLHQGGGGGCGSSPGAAVLSRLRQIRGLYQKAIQSVGKAKVKDMAAAQQQATTTVVPRDYETALTNLCHEYQQFERTFGSDQSLANATRIMQKKLQKTTSMNKRQQQQQQQQQQQGQEAGMEDEDTTMNDAFVEGSEEEQTTGTKRKSSNADEPTKKKRKTGGEEPISAAATTEETNKASTAAPTQPQQQQQPKPKPPKVKIGHIFHKAHPFTVRLSNLAVETQEMDLVETFRQEHKCGPVVHARIMREKPLHAKGHEAKVGISKGWGLLQFEERESVEKALELSEEVEIHGRKVQVERSHVPAVGIVPPGMHRPAAAKQQKKKKYDNMQAQGEGKNGEDSKPAEAKTSSNSSFGVLAFRPRGVMQKKKEAGPKKAHPKMKLSVPTAKGDDEK